MAARTTRTRPQGSFTNWVAPALDGQPSGEGNPLLEALQNRKKKLKQTHNLENVDKKKNRFSVAPNKIEDAVFVNREPIGTVLEAFDKWGAELVLVDFFAYSCTNCIRTIPYMRDLYAKYKDHGLEVIAFARPEFEFEGEVPNVKAWIERNNIAYPVATDSKGTNWRNFSVTMWPTHLLIQKDHRTTHKGEVRIVERHAGDRNGHILLNKIQDLLKLDWPKVEEFNTEGFIDAEVFLGKAHRSKNSGSGGCNKLKACEVEDVSTIDAWSKGLPEPQKGKHTVYGAAWCPWCQRAKIVLEMTNTPFDYIDVDEYGGKGAAQRALKDRKLISEDWKSIPMVFGADGKFLGGFDDLKASMEDDKSFDMEEVNKRAMADTTAVYYNKNNNDIKLRQERSAAWSLDAESLAAKEADAALKVDIEMPGAEKSGIRMYVVCEPEKDASHHFKEGWIEVDGTRKSIAFPGRHYIKSFDGAKVNTVLKASSQMKMFVVWLTTEPYISDAVQ